MAWNEERKIITVGEINDLYPTLGIPHFQRGLVWGNDSVSALLESLLLDTPCGSFVFWKSINNRENGVSLIEDGEGEIKYLIVDGQQRIRSIHDVFHDVDEDYTENNGLQQGVQNDSEVATKHRVWCINLTRTPELEGFLEPHAKEYSLFVLTTDPRYADTRSPLRYNTLPLLPLLVGDKNQSLEIFEKCLKLKAETSRSQLDEGLIKLQERVRNMLSREFFVTVKKPSDNRADIVNLYNRINVGGKKVEAEERAFARLVAMDQLTWSHIASIFELVHGTEKDLEKDVKPDQEVGSLDRDQVLRRQKENLFGFKLFIRTFIQVCNYHFNQPIGSSSFSFGLVDRRIFGDKLGHGDPTKVKELWQITKDVIQHVRAVLNDELYCDELVFLPETFCLVPLFQLLIQYPGLRDSKYQKLLGWYALLLLLSDLNMREVLGLASKIQQGSGVAFEQIPDIMQDLDRRVRDLFSKQRVLNEAESIQNRYVLLLYWLLRKNEARDFSYMNLNADKQKKLFPGKELQLEAAVDPEKQHIVPFSQLVNRLGDADAQRGSSHRFNNIGNLTYISRIFNHYETGLSDDFVDLQYDSNKVLSAHLLWNDVRKGSIQEAYKSVKKAFEQNSRVSADQASKLYDAFCRKRQALIAMGFEQWLDQLKKESLEQMGVAELKELKALRSSESREEADVPRFVEVSELKPTQRIRLFGYEDSVEDRLVELAVPLRKKRFIVADHFLEMKLTEKKHVWLLLDEDGVTIHFDHRIAEELRRDILGTLNMELGEDLVYRKGAVETERVMILAKAMERTHELETEIDLSIKEKMRPDDKDFKTGWSGRHGPKALENLNIFTSSMASLKNPEIGVTHNKYGRPFFSLKIKGKIVQVLRPRTYAPSLCDELHKTATEGTEQLEAVKRFRNSLSDAGIGKVFGKQDRIEIHLPIATEKLKPLERSLKKLSEELGEVMKR